MEKKRQALIRAIAWNSQGGAYGFGGNVALTLGWAVSTLSGKNSEPKSAVWITGPPKKYTDEELEKLLDISKSVTEYYYTIMRSLHGANFWFIDKQEGRIKPWMVKKLTWDHPNWYLTFDEALMHVCSERMSCKAS